MSSVLLASLVAQQFLAGTPPNFVFFLTDDQGVTSTSLQAISADSRTKSGYYRTPELIKWAKKAGTIFENGYAPHASCGPSRSSILTGRTPAQLRKITGNMNNVMKAGNEILSPPASKGVSEDISINGELLTSWLTLPSMLKSLNSKYLTAQFGKWHVSEKGPRSYGFDEGELSNNNQAGNVLNCQYKGNSLPADGRCDGKMVYQMTDEVIEFIERALKAKRPYFAHVEQFAIHADTLADPDRIKYYAGVPKTAYHDEAEVATLVEDLDNAFGYLMTWLENKKQLKNTYVVFSSDNGASSKAKFVNHPFRSGKSQVYEGGIRVPFVVFGGKTAKGKRQKTPANLYDMLATFYELAGGKGEAAPGLDSESLVKAIRGKKFKRKKGMVFYQPVYQDVKDVDAQASPLPVTAYINSKGDKKLVIKHGGSNPVQYFKKMNKAKGYSETKNSFKSGRKDMLAVWKELRSYILEKDLPRSVLNPGHKDNKGSSDDRDGDGLKDSWEWENLCTYGFGANDDIDGDGKTNLQEQASGTDPLS